MPGHPHHQAHPKDATSSDLAPPCGNPAPFPQAPGSSNPSTTQVASQPWFGPRHLETFRKGRWAWLCLGYPSETWCGFLKHHGSSCGSHGPHICVSSGTGGYVPHWRSCWQRSTTTSHWPSTAIPESLSLARSASLSMASLLQKTRTRTCPNRFRKAPPSKPTTCTLSSPPWATSSHRWWPPMGPRRPPAVPLRPRCSPSCSTIWISSWPRTRPPRGPCWRPS
mmetsp:Transcript_114759/g.199604  ORF Transcript_114759/g.199604 Transcript_114759/m.199604 type:complete len:223 (-) Transcript_114759:303-971(-)